MHITIEDKTVGENIRSCLELLRRAEAKREKRGAALIEKSYKAFLNRKTGKLLFADDFKDQIDFLSHDWKELSIDYAFDPLTESFHAIAYESEDASEAFQLSGLSPVAVGVIKSTIHTLNKLSSLVRGTGSDLITKIKALCKLQMDVGSIEKDKSILISAWHSLDRVGAEKMLQGKPDGTFLFREDYFAKLLSAQLTQQYGKEVKCVTLTLLEPENKVSDFTFVHLDHLWRWYDDALFCNVTGFKQIEDLLNTCFKDRAKHPLYHTYLEEQIA
jgi:hypothetical protein